ncbi:multi-sensor hybrid histidine kinase [Stylonychia lemnae]|uniref:Multi-sensor hybrid histidine kinase n=1 Tax=Stylonychia lemnae TaxID=5949 RepID=A0A078AWZ1_STYLE|nr:multi-sensor hybrid histidine kinase [Stylonychia lemnae]|eukprot:CDW86955.1 multi-sensor hybrid histidine kinase [Stylonychia lemnae]
MRIKLSSKDQGVQQKTYIQSLIKKKQLDADYYKSWIAVVVVAIIEGTFFWATKKYQGLALQFSNIQTIFGVLVIMELAVMNQRSPQVDGFTALTALVASLSSISYCKKQLLYCYIICCVYIYSRLIRSHHDGIIITNIEKIVFYNQKINDIFDLGNSDCNEPQIEQACCNMEKNAQESQRNIIKVKNEVNKQKLIECFNNAQIKKGQFQPGKMIPGYELLAGCRNIWDYIQLQQLIRKSIIKLQNAISLDGIYFKYSGSCNFEQQIAQEIPDNEIGESQRKLNNLKRLQVFSQTINTGCQTLVITTIRDMSHWLELEKQKTLTLFKTQAFASAAHEFRNPLNAIISSLDLLKDMVDKERGLQYYQTAKNCSNLLLYLVNDILDYSQFESQKLLMNPEDVSIEDIIMECLDVLRFKAEQKRLQLSYEISQEFPRRLLTDHNRLRQILINLISNGIKYTSSGYVKIKAYICIELNKICIDVEDSGVGIQQEEQEQLYNAYCKIMANRSLNKEGCGLGLTISRNLALALGGELKVKSEIGKGSIFTIQLPRNIAKQEFQNYRPSYFQNIFLEEQQFQIPQQTEERGRRISYQQRKKRQDPYRIMNTSIQTENLLDDSQTYLRENLNQHAQNYLKTMNHIFLDKNSVQNDSPNSSIDPDMMVIPNESGIDHQIDVSRDFMIHKGSMEIFENCNHAKILIVDDDPYNIIVLQGILQQLKQPVVDKGYNGKEGLAMVEQDYQRRFECSFHTPGRELCQQHDCYRLLIIDNQMPIMNGFELGRAVREKQQKGEYSPETKLMLLTGDEFMCSNAEVKVIFDFIMTKPLSVTKLREILTQINLF